MVMACDDVVDVVDVVDVADSDSVVRPSNESFPSISHRTIVTPTSTT
jgi:hypothetical protein